jgi:hypothetical protein
MDLVFKMQLSSKMETPLTQAVFTANAGDPSGYLGIPILRINTSGHPKGLGPKKNKPYFFLGDLQVRHCRIYRNGFLDYTIRGTKFYESLEQWANDCGSSPDQVCFGFVSDNEYYKSINLATLFLPLRVEQDNFATLERRLGQMNLGLESVAVVIQNRVRMAFDFLGE